MASQAISLSNSDEPGSDPADSDSLVTSLTADIEKLGLVASSTSTHPTKETAVFLQDICLQHHFIRSRDTSAIVEKPERLRAVNVGLAAAIAHLEEPPAATKVEPEYLLPTASTSDDLAAALGRMNLAAQGIDPLESSSPVSIIKSTASVDMFNHPAVKFIHGDVDVDVYLENLRAWARDSRDKILKGESEIPESLSQGDLYLCPTSVDAIQGAVGTVCEAVDAVMHNATEQRCKRAFVSVRPPGHHCGEDTPAGFCFVNNVAIGAAHAHLQHGIRRVVILDIDLHHGNGTQAIAWQINEETYRKTLETEYSESEAAPPETSGLKIYYGSIHDILSYPCEDGKTELVQAASVSLHGPHGQHIENIHLQPYTSDEHFFDVLYKEQYSKLLKKAGKFIEGSTGKGDDVLVFISCGFDACQHEYPSMSRHGRTVPTSFYHRFTVDACAFADRYAQGRLVSVLEGGYSDRALASGAMAHLCGLVNPGEGKVNEQWWNVENLEKLERATKKRRGGKQSLTPVGASESWLDRALVIFSSLDDGSAQYMAQASSLRPAIPIPPSSMTLRERKKTSVHSLEGSPTSSPPRKRNTPTGKSRKSQSPQKQPRESPPLFATDTPENSSRSSLMENPPSNSDSVALPKKLPRVILRLGPPPDALAP
ncbi:hypothetical protein PILCRDRAFT_76443 [Piloderma croceum F 1598]|uniref:Histone deacetylase domain-containing protein n=1 Tax=Piloderma croceum (strain F 1598) TaxID=765440 RepID=A0A0C3EYU7_PILCF|nr:hypothetical protein PILCRDRAFT_76443 [Piloderma croceum F 1598]